MSDVDFEGITYLRVEFKTQGPNRRLSIKLVTIQPKGYFCVFVYCRGALDGGGGGNVACRF